MPKPYVTILAKAVQSAMRLRGGGSALPGLVVERIDPQFMSQTLAQLPMGTVVVSGTNGKTTTTKMVVELLESQGLKVFTNRTGSNFTRGVAAALLGEIDIKGKLDADIAVLELDEAHAVHFVKVVAPAYCLLLNVMRDQLDRFGEIDTTAKMLQIVGLHTTKGVVINRDDPRIGNQDFFSDFPAPLRSYGVHPDLLAMFPSDDTMRDASPAAKHKAAKLYSDDVSLVSLDGQRAVIAYGGKNHGVNLQLKGIYNVQNAVGAIALVRMVLGEKLDSARMLDALSRVTPAFGRGESLIVNDQPLELVLVKNPSGFRLALKSFPAEGYATMIAINDNYADGRDMSWLWDVDFDSLSDGVAMVSGVRAADMALRLKYEAVSVIAVTESLSAALDQFIHSHADQPKRIYCTYTAMLELRRLLAKKTSVEKIR